MTQLNKLTKLVEDGYSFFYSEKFKDALVYRVIAEHLLKNDVQIQKHGHWVCHNEDDNIFLRPRQTLPNVKP